MLLVCERKPRPPPPAGAAPGGEDDCCKKPAAGKGQPTQAGRGRHVSPSGSGDASDDYGESDDHSDSSAGDRYGLAQGFAAGEYPHRFGVPLLVPFPPELAAKGPAAEKLLREVRRACAAVAGGCPPASDPNAASCTHR